MKKHIHIFGASGSGTTTISQKVCGHTGYSHFDSDSYFWLPTPGPFTVTRGRGDYAALMDRDLNSSPHWVLSGSVTGWYDELVSVFDLIVFVYVPTDIRVERLRRREAERYGDAILPGNSRHQASAEFIEWASAYDSGTRSGRSLSKHEAWLKTAACPVLRIVNLELDGHSANRKSGMAYPMPYRSNI